MATNESLKETLGHFKQQRQAKLEELRSLDITILEIQKQLGEVPDEQSDRYVLPGIPEVKPQIAGQVGGAYKPRADEFFGMSQAEAARTYLEKVGHAVLLEEILKAITSGGCKVGGADPKRTLSIALSQGKRDFVSTGGGNFGLRKFYNMPKLGRPEGTIPGKKAKGKRGAKNTAKRIAKPKASTAKPYDSAEVSAAISEILSDHKPKSPEEVLASVERKVGYSVKKIAVYGTLRKKEFEQVGDKYRLRQPGEESQVVQ